MKSNTSVIVFCVVLSLFLSGCIPKTIVDEVSLIHNVGFENDDGLLKAIVVFPNYTEENKPTLISATAKNTTTLKGKLADKTQNNLEMGQVRVMLLNENLNELEILQILDSVCKDPKIGVIRIAVSSSVNKILETSLKESPVYLKNLIDNSVENGGIPTTDLHTMYDQHFGRGIDMYFPTLKLDSNEKILVDGMSIFKKNELKYKIPANEAVLLKFMTDKNKSGRFEFNLNMNGHKTNFGLVSLYGKHKQYIVSNKNSQKVKINLVLNVNIEELPDWIDFHNERDSKTLKKKIQNSISSESEKLLISFQKNQVDPIGIGRIYGTKQKNWTEKDFYENVYPNLKFEVQTKIIFRQVGVGK